MLKLVTELTATRQLLTVEEAKCSGCSCSCTVFRDDNCKTVDEMRNKCRVNYRLRMHYDGETGITRFYKGSRIVLFKEQDGWVLLDYKTDRVRGRFDSDEEIDS